MSQALSITDHRRDIAGLKYVYPVLSRRAGGLSIGINFNTNNACNWRCVYCQVPDLKRGAAPSLDFALLEAELRFFIDFVQHGDFFDQFNVPKAQQSIKDIALSGNGEPTSLEGFDQAVQLIGDIAVEKGVFPGSRFVLISNGSLIQQQKVQQGLRTLNVFGGEVWFKLDRATDSARKTINNCVESRAKILEKIQCAASLCHTKIQTCLFDYAKAPWSESEQGSYIEMLTEIKVVANVNEVMLYSLARPSQQPEVDQLIALNGDSFFMLKERLVKAGFKVLLNV